VCPYRIDTLFLEKNTESLNLKIIEARLREAIWNRYKYIPFRQAPPFRVGSFTNSNYFKNLEIFKSQRKTLDHLLTITHPSLLSTFDLRSFRLLLSIPL
jgi:hypothetical protein